MTRMHVEQIEDLYRVTLETAENCPMMLNPVTRKTDAWEPAVFVVGTVKDGEVVPAHDNFSLSDMKCRAAMFSTTSAARAFFANKGVDLGHFVAYDEEHRKLINISDEEKELYINL